MSRREHTAIPKQRDGCRQRNGDCSLASKRRRNGRREGKDCGNDGPWTPRKTKGRFSSAPTVRGNRKKRDFHIPTVPAGRGKVENEKHVSHFPACCLYVQNRKEPGGRFAPPSGSFFNENMLSSKDDA